MPLDLSTPLPEQLPFDVLLHKASDELVLGAGGLPQLSGMARDLEAFLACHPDVCTVDPLGCTARVRGCSVQPHVTTPYAHGTASYSHGTTPYANYVSHGTAPCAHCIRHGTTPHAHGTTPYAHGTTPYAHGTTLYAHGTTSHAHGTTPHAHGTTPYAHGTASYSHGTTPLIMSVMVLRHMLIVSIMVPYKGPSSNVTHNTCCSPSTRRTRCVTCCASHRSSTVCCWGS